jgi:hypothetical protein
MCPSHVPQPCEFRMRRDPDRPRVDDGSGRFYGMLAIRSCDFRERRFAGSIGELNFPQGDILETLDVTSAECALDGQVGRRLALQDRRPAPRAVPGKQED